MNPLVLAAHGSADPRFADVMTSLASMIAERRPELDVRIGYLEHGRPLAEVSSADCVIVPVLLTNGYHVHIDIPSQTGGATITPPIGPDHRLAVAMANRLRDAGWRGEPVVLAAAGSADQQALDDVRTATADLSSEIGVAVSAAFIGSGEPALSAAPAAVATYLLGPGKFADLAAACGAPIVARPIGADPLVADIVLDRYDRAVVTAKSKARALTSRGAAAARPDFGGLTRFVQTCVQPAVRRASQTGLATKYGPKWVCAG